MFEQALRQAVGACDPALEARITGAFSVPVQKARALHLLTQAERLSRGVREAWCDQDDLAAAASAGPSLVAADAGVLAAVDRGARLPDPRENFGAQAVAAAETKAKRVVQLFRVIDQLRELVSEVAS
jgi:hypothetical protein